MKEIWNEVDAYFESSLMPQDEVLEEILAANAAAGLPAHDVSPAQGKLLYLLAKLHGARKILELGTLGAYSTVWLARALSEGGYVVSLEADPRHAEVARKNVARADLDKFVEIRVGRALDTLPRLAEEGLGPFDLIFIDADKTNNAAYFQWALKLSRPASLIIVDNVVRGGAVLDAESKDASVQGVRRFLETAAKALQVEATALQTVGAKGYDGFVLVRVKDI